MDRLRYRPRTGEWFKVEVVNMGRAYLHGPRFDDWRTVLFPLPARPSQER